MADAASRRAKLGILAGGGLLPARIAQRCEAEGRPYFITAFTGQTDPAVVEGRPHMWARLGGAGAVIERLHAERVGEICMIGPMRRPSLAELAPDVRAAGFFARIGLRALGDNALLSAIAAVLQEEGFAIVGAKSLLKDMLLRPGTATEAEPTPGGWSDIGHGRHVLASLGALDIGQAVVVQQGVVIALEAAEGTDAMIERAGTLLRDGPAGILVKAPKPQQDRRLDLPTIGAATAERAAAAGLAGIAAAAAGTLIVDRERVVAICEHHGMFLHGFEQEGAGQ